jgi:hypothetical protein
VERLSVVGLVPLVDNVLVENIRNKIVSDTLHLVTFVDVVLVQDLGQSKDTSVRIGSNDLDVLVVLLEATSDTSNGTTGTSTSDKSSDVTTSLLPDLLGGAELVGVGVVLVAVLVEDVGVGKLLLETSSNTDVRLGSVPSSLCRSTDDGSAKGTEDGNLFGRHLFGESNDGLVALDGTDESQTDTTIQTNTVRKKEKA